MDENKIKKYGRVPQNFVFDNKALKNKFCDSAAIIQDLMIYYSFNKLNVNLFGEFEFTLKDFCDTMGYSRTTLQRTLPEVEALQEKPIIDDHIFDSAFEYALYRSLKENVVITRKKDGKTTYIPYQLIDYMTVHYDKSTKKKTKRVYVVEFSAKFISNIFKEYFVFDYDDYNRIQDKHLSVMGLNRSYYLSLCKMIAVIRNLRYDTVKQGKVWSEADNVYNMTVDQACEMFDMNYCDCRDRKKLLTKRLNKIQRQLVNTKFTYKYKKYKSDSRWEYMLSFSFSNDMLDSFDEKLRAKFLHRLMSECEQVYGRTINNSYLDYIKGRSSSNVNVEESFFAWFSSEKDMQDSYIIDKNNKYIKLGKLSIFKRVYKDIYSCDYNSDEIDFSLIFSSRK